MKGFDVLKVKSAVKNHNKFDLSRTHLTTMDFGQIVPLMVEETVPGDKFSVGANYFSRMAPLVKPTYGKFDFRTVAAFVPYHQVAWDSDAWLAGKTTWEGQTPVQRTLTVEAIEQFVRLYCTTTGNINNAQFSFTDANGTINYRIFTNVGSYYVKVLNALGYAIPQNVDLRTGSTYYTSVRTNKLSAMPLLAFFKLYNDYMSQSQRFNTSQLSSALQAIKYGKTLTGYNPSTGTLNYQVLKLMFDNLFLNYDNDYFTSAWQKPNNALGAGESINSAAVPEGVPNGASVGSVNADNILTQSVSTTINLGQRSLDFLKDFDDWVRRNNYSGSRAVQQIYSRFGIKTDDYRSHYANIICTDKMPVQVGDVTATGQQYIGAGNKENLGLGDYCGKGIMSGSKGFDISVSDYGLLIVLGYFTIVPMNPFGYDRRVLRTAALDYYNPEFDGLGADAISVGEYFEAPLNVSGDSTSMNDVFGFTERYNAYRYGRDVITGEFRNYHNDGDMNVWHTGRLLGDIRKAGNLVAQSTAVNTLPQSDSEYNRIFSVTDGSIDHFYLTAQFKVDAVRPMLNLNQVTRLGEGDTSVPRNGNVIS